MNELACLNAYGVLTEPATLTIQRLLPGPIERIEAVAPEALVEAQPLVCAGERAGGEAAQMRAAAHLAADQSGALQRLDVFRGGGERHGEGFGKLADRPLAAGEFAQHPPARGVAKGVKDGSELGRLKFNHVVEYKRPRSESQPAG